MGQVVLGVGVLLLVLLAVDSFWPGWRVVYEGTGTRRDGVRAVEAVGRPGTALKRTPAPIEVFEVGDDHVGVIFPGARCTGLPASVTAHYQSDLVELVVDPDPRGCRDTSSEGVPFSGVRALLAEPVAGREVVVRCARSSRCDPPWGG